MGLLVVGSYPWQGTFLNFPFESSLTPRMALGFSGIPLDSGLEAAFGQVGSTLGHASAPCV